METPSSTRRVTRSQTSAMAASNSSNLLISKKVEESDKYVEKSRHRSGKKQQQDRSALIDITNDSPIVGLATGNLETPSSAMSKKRITARTPGSGEALLRGQVKTLLQRVEEEAEFSKITIENRPVFNLQGLVNSPINLVAPTPANTPQVLNFSANGNGGLPSVTPSPVEEKFMIYQMVTEMCDGKEQKDTESEDSVTRSLMLDFIEKSQPSDSFDSSSVVTHQGELYADTESSVEKLSKDDDDASIWSIQVNASSTRDEEEVEDQECVDCLEEECDYHLGFGEEEEEYGNGDGLLLLDELCEGMSKISVNGASNFSGKHIRFTYDSDDELNGEEEVRGG